MTKEVLARFVKDQRIPINVFDEPYFSYYLNLYEADFQSMTKYQKMLATLKQFPSEHDFLEYYYQIRDKIITSMEQKKSYINFLNADMNQYRIEEPNLPNVCKGDVYNQTNVGSYFVSIDLCKANYQVMRKFDKDLVFNTDTYEDFIAMFTDLDYFKESKYTRQVIFGKLNPKRQGTMQKYYSKQILDYLMNEKGVQGTEIAVFTFDEVVLRAKGYLPAEKCQELKADIKEKLGLDVSVTSFFLEQIGDKDFFVKKEENGKITFKKVPTNYQAQAYKKYKGLPIEEMDMFFYFEDNLAKFVRPIF